MDKTFLHVSLASWFMTAVFGAFGIVTAWVYFSLGLSWQKWLLGWRALDVHHSHCHLDLGSGDRLQGGDRGEKA